jgi:protein SCO1/2
MTHDVTRGIAARRHGRIAPLAGLGTLLLAAAGLHALLQRPAALAPRPETETIGGPFRLVDGHSRIVTDRDFPGRYLLVYFGYTGCPDVCPTTLSAVSRAITLLGKRGAEVQPIFITIDPGRDTPAVLGSFVAAFSPRLIGLTGSPAALRAVEHAYHVIVRFGPDGIDHSAVLYLMAPNGAFLAPLPANSNAATIAADLNHDLG